MWKKSPIAGEDVFELRLQKSYPKNPDASIGLMVETSHPQNSRIGSGNSRNLRT